MSREYLKIELIHYTLIGERLPLLTTRKKPKKQVARNKRVEQSTFMGQAAFQAGMHGVSGGSMSAIGGGQIGSGFLSGMVSSIVSSGIEGLGSLGKQVKEVGIKGYGVGEVSTFASRNKDLFKAIMIASGGLSDGLSSMISG